MNETIEDIIREKREMAAQIRAHLSNVPARREDQLLEADSLDREADRLEAAAKREHMFPRAIKVPIEVVPTGNAAAMREALEAIRNLAYEVQDMNREGDGDVRTSVPATWVIDIVSAALSAPPRNCDAGTPEEQTRRMYAQLCSKQRSCYELPSGEHCPMCREGIDCRLAWAQMPYKAEEGGAE